MSYILEALKKAESEREIGQVPGIGSEHHVTVTTRVSRWVYALLFVLGINAGLLVYVIWPEQDLPLQAKVESTRIDPPAPARVVPTEPRIGTAPPKQGGVPLAPPVVKPKVPVPVPKKPEVRPPVQSPESAAALRPLMPDSEKPAKPVHAKPVANTEKSPKPAPATESKPPVPEVVAKVEKVAVPGTKAVAEPIPGIAPEANPEPKPEVVRKPKPKVKKKSRSNLPVWPQVSGHLFREINSGLRMDVHVYSEDLEERFVLINMQKYNEGEQLQEGPVVDEITPEGVILSFKGQRFRVQAQ